MKGFDLQGISLNLRLGVLRVELTLMFGQYYSDDIRDICEHVQRGLKGRILYGALTSAAIALLVDWRVGSLLAALWFTVSLWEVRAFRKFGADVTNVGAEANMLASIFINMCITSAPIVITASQMNAALSLLAGVYASSTLISLVILFKQERVLLIASLIPLALAIVVSAAMLAYYFTVQGELVTAAAMLIVPLGYVIMGHAPLSSLREHDRKMVETLKEVRTQKALAEARTADAEAAKAEADRANSAKSDFLASMSHEIRTPMNGVIGMTEMLASSGLDETQKRLAQIIQVSGESLLVIINDILDFAKLEAREIELHPEWFSLRDLIDSVVGIIGTKVDAEAVSFSSWIDPELPDRFYGDQLRVRQTLINLAGNASKFTHEGHIRLFVQKHPLRSDSEQTTLTFSVQDSGIGIAPDKIDSMFDKFSQAETGTTRNYGGTGLGLAICRELVSLLGGTLWAESELGKGSTFSFFIPLVAERRSETRHDEERQIA